MKILLIVFIVKFLTKLALQALAVAGPLSYGIRLRNGMWFLVLIC